MSHEPEKPPAESKSHWEEVYNTRAPEAVSWYAPHLMTSLAYLKRTGMPHTVAIVDIGGGQCVGRSKRRSSPSSLARPSGINFVNKHVAPRRPAAIRRR